MAEEAELALPGGELFDDAGRSALHLFADGVRAERVRVGEHERVLAADLKVAMGEIARLRADAEMWRRRARRHEQTMADALDAQTIGETRAVLLEVRAGGGAEAMREAAAKLIERHPRVMLAPAFAEALAAGIRALPIPAPVEPVAVPTPDLAGIRERANKGPHCDGCDRPEGSRTRRHSPEVCPVAWDGHHKIDDIRTLLAALDERDRELAALSR